jgi:peptidoglycan/xylan/chitin deacetylase (PgdA/CDA1 family)
MNPRLEEFIDFIKYESKFGLRVLLYDLLMINKLYFRKYFINKLLDFAKQNNYQFTFFVRSNDLNSKKIILKRLKNDGHEIASHGNIHVLYENKSKKWLKEELTKSKNEFLKYKIQITGFRSPFLSENKELYDVLDDLKFEYVSNRFNHQNDQSGDFKLKQDKIIYPSDWHGLVVERLKINEISEKWYENKGTLLLHPWIFLKYMDKIKSLLKGQKDFRIYSNINKNKLKISFDMY